MRRSGLLKATVDHTGMSERREAGGPGTCDRHVQEARCLPDDAGELLALLAWEDGFFQAGNEDDLKRSV